MKISQIIVYLATAVALVYCQFGAFLASDYDGGLRRINAIESLALLLLLMGAIALIFLPRRLIWITLAGPALSLAVEALLLVGVLSQSLPLRFVTRFYDGRWEQFLILPTLLSLVSIALCILNLRPGREDIDEVTAEKAYLRG